MKSRASAIPLSVKGLYQARDPFIPALALTRFRQNTYSLGAGNPFGPSVLTQGVLILRQNS